MIDAMATLLRDGLAFLVMSEDLVIVYNIFFKKQVFSMQAGAMGIK